MNQRLLGDARYHVAWGGLSLEVDEILVSTGGMAYVFFVYMF